MQKLKIIFPKAEEIQGRFFFVCQKDTRCIHDAKERFLFVADAIQSKTLAKGNCYIIYITEVRDFC
jgi:hypothetical protein